MGKVLLQDECCLPEQDKWCTVYLLEKVFVLLSQSARKSLFPQTPMKMKKMEMQVAKTRFFFFFLETARVTGFIGQRERTGTGTQRDKCLERETFVYPGGELGTVRDRWRPGSIIRGVAVVVNT